MTHFGELAAFATACCWVVTGISFEQAGKRVGSLAVNLIRLVMALLIMTVFTTVTRGMPLPLDATPMPGAGSSHPALSGLSSETCSCFRPMC